MKLTDKSRRPSSAQPLDAAAQELTRKHWGLAFHMARKYYYGCSRRVSLDELQSEALFGLVYAASLFDSSRRVPFPSYASLVISHRLLHAIEDWCSRGRINQIALSDLTDSPEDFDSPCGRTRNLVERAAERELIDRVRRVLPPRWFDALQLYYAQGHTLEEIGDRFGVTRERVRQLLNKAIDRARERAAASF